jgi:UDP-N-acetylmuramate dehydrogenase
LEADQKYPLSNPLGNPLKSTLEGRISAQAGLNPAGGVMASGTGQGLVADRTSGITSEDLRQRGALLRQRFGDLVRLTAISSLSAIGVGGEAALITAGDETTLTEILKFHREQSFPLLPVGGFTNLLFPGGVFGATLVKLAGKFEGFKIEGTTVTCGAGASVRNLLKATAEASLTGLEMTAGLPGTVGGAVRGNAGSADCGLAEKTVSLKLINREGQGHTLDRSDLKTGYRSLALPEGLADSVITEVVFELQREKAEIISEKIQEKLNKRRSQPLGAKSLGCFFKNPEGHPAGQLIDQCGLKGHQIGGAEVSDRHANFIINQGAASFQDIVSLAALVQARVREKFGYELQLEVKIFDAYGGVSNLSDCVS